MAACPSSQTGPGDMCRIPVPPKAEHAGDLSSYPTTVFMPDGDDYCSISRATVDDDDGHQLSRSVPVSSGAADTSWTRPSLVRPEDRHKWVNPPPNKNPFGNCATTTSSRSRQRLPTHTGVSGMQRPAAPVTVRHDSWSHSTSSTTLSADDRQQLVARTLPDWRPENLPRLAARSPPSRHGHTCARTPATQSAAAADCQERCSVADCVYCSSAAPDRR